MSKNTKQTSSRIGRLASETLQSSSASQVAKSLAASALAQRAGEKRFVSRNCGPWVARAISQVHDKAPIPWL